MKEENSKFISQLPKKDQELIKEIMELKKKHKVLILAHTYQRESIQLIADVLGDSLGLAKAAKKETEADYILFAGVRFMAETAAILNPEKKVIFPDKASRCKMASYLTADMLKEYKEKNPGVPIILYINSTAESKTMADVVCTSSNSLTIVKAMIEEHGSNKFAFSPDKNLGAYISDKLNIPVDIIPKEGNCYVHNMYKKEDVLKAREKYPDATLLVHPEAPSEVLENADFIGSTSQIINYAKENPETKEFIIGTEQGVTVLLCREYPNRLFVPLNERAVCIAMKRITLEKILNALKNLDSDEFLVQVDKEIADASINAIDKMMKLSIKIE
ncbi:MAG: quinolinate synthase NadA [archaeon]|nr:quinolinate synthase NadA [archaeon]